MLLHAVNWFHTTDYLTGKCDKAKFGNTLVKIGRYFWKPCYDQLRLHYQRGSYWPIVCYKEHEFLNVICVSVTRLMETAAVLKEIR